MISREFGEELAKLRALKNEILGLKMKEDEYGSVSSLDRLRIYIKTILDLMDNVDSYDTCIELFKYAERIEAEMPNDEEAEDVVKVMDAIRDVIAQNPRVSKTLRKIVDNFGYAAAMSILILIMVAILAILQMKVGDER